MEMEKFNLKNQNINEGKIIKKFKNLTKNQNNNVQGTVKEKPANKNLENGTQQSSAQIIDQQENQKHKNNFLVRQPKKSPTIKTNIAQIGTKNQVNTNIFSQNLSDNHGLNSQGKKTITSNAYPNNTTNNINQKNQSPNLKDQVFYQFREEREQSLKQRPSLQQQLQNQNISTNSNKSQERKIRIIKEKFSPNLKFDIRNQRELQQEPGEVVGASDLIGGKKFVIKKNQVPQKLGSNKNINNNNQVQPNNYQNIVNNNCDLMQQYKGNTTYIIKSINNIHNNSNNQSQEEEEKNIRPIIANNQNNNRNLNNEDDEEEEEYKDEIQVPVIRSNQRQEQQTQTTPNSNNGGRSSDEEFKELISRLRNNQEHLYEIRNRINNQPPSLRFGNPSNNYTSTSETIIRNNNQQLITNAAVQNQQVFNNSQRIAQQQQQREVQLPRYQQISESSLNEELQSQQDILRSNNDSIRRLASFIFLTRIGQRLEDLQTLANNLSEIQRLLISIRMLESISPQQQQDKGLTEEQINDFPVIRFKKINIDDNSTCTICFEDIKEEEKIKVLTCVHKFHPICIDQWLVSKAECPNCKADQNQYFQNK